MTTNSPISLTPPRDILKKYSSVIQLVDACGPWNERLKQIHRIVMDPSFTFNECPFASFLSVMLANSSYWLDKELFDTSVVKKDLTDKELTGIQKAHLYLLDIGSTLMGKGFPLNQETIDKFVPKDSPLYSWSKNFLIQCNKRNTWLKNTKFVSHKQLSFVPSSKENKR